MIFGMEQIQKLESYVAKYPAIDQLLVSLEQKTKVKKIYLLYGKYWVFKKIGSFISIQMGLFDCRHCRYSRHMAYVRLWSTTFV